MKRKIVRLHWKTQDNRHWFCCGAGEAFIQAVTGLVDDDTLEALLPHVEVYARALAADELREAAADITWTGTSTVRDLLTSRADNLIDPCRCPGEHCGDCGCCPRDFAKGE